MMLLNTARQLVWIDYDGLNQNCFASPDCWTALPPSVRQTLRASPSGQGFWPQPWMNALLYAVVIASLLYLLMGYRTLARNQPAKERLLRSWLVVAGTAMLVCALFGGAIADPQYRYQGRLIWLVPLLAIILFLLNRNSWTSSDQDVEPNR